MATPSSKLPILVLHGYGMSAASILAKTGALRSEVKKLPVEFFAIDGPCDCVKDAPLPQAATSAVATVSSSGEEGESKNTSSPSSMLPPQLTLEPGARAWYSFANMPVTGRYELFEEGMTYLTKHCQDREAQGLAPYGGLFAFSQGTIMATVWATRLMWMREQQRQREQEEKKNASAEEEGRSTTQQGSETQPVTISSTTALPNCMRHLKFVVLCSGLLPKDVELRNEILSSVGVNNNNNKNSTPLSISSMHIVGQSDKLVEPQLTMQLGNCFADGGTATAANDNGKEGNAGSSVKKVIYSHDGGHVIPSAARKEFKAFLQSQLS